MSVGFWDWSVGAYAKQNVEAVCLRLQDQHEQNVPLLLWAAWAAATGRVPDEETLEAACDAAVSWDGVAVAPLRAVRRTLKAPVPDMDDDARLALRDQVKAVELEAERRLMAALEAMAPAPAGRGRSMLDGMVEVARVWSTVVPRPALRELTVWLSD